MVLRGAGDACSFAIPCVMENSRISWRFPAPSAGPRKAGRRGVTSSTVRDVFADFHDDARVVLRAFLRRALPQMGAFFAPSPCPRWVRGAGYRAGRRRPTPCCPGSARGAATAIEDAVILCRALIEFEDADEALRRYENARRERVTVIHRESLSGGGPPDAAGPGRTGPTARSHGRNARTLPLRPGNRTAVTRHGLSYSGQRVELSGQGVGYAGHQGPGRPRAR